MRAVGSGTSQDITRYVLLTHYPRSVGFTSGGGGGGGGFLFLMTYNIGTNISMEVEVF